MKNPDSKQRLFEIITRLDKTFKTKLNEEFGVGIDDPTKEEMVDFLQNKFKGLIDPTNIDDNNFDIESAIYWFGNNYHGGQNSNLYSALSTSQFRPGPMHKNIEDEESETATMMYQELVNKYGGSAQENVVNANNIQQHDIETNEDIDQQVNEFIPHGSYTISNAGGYEIMLDDSGDAAKVRDAFGSDNPKTSDWLPIEYIFDKETGESEPVIDPNGYNIPLNMVMRINNENSLHEVFGWSVKERKANTQQIETAKQEIQKYPPSHLFAQPGRNSSPQDNKQLMTTRLNMAKQYMPTLTKLMPHLFDLTQSYGDMVRIYNGKPLNGLIPSNWYFLKGEEGYMDNNQAVQKLNQELDAIGQKMEVQKNKYMNTSMNEYKYPDNSETYEKLLDTAQEEGYITSHERIAEYISATAKEIATEFDNLHSREQDVFWNSYYKKFLKKIKKINEQGLEEDKWIQKAVDPKHKGYCTPMTKDTCTPKRKALAKRFKAGIEDENIQEEILPDNPKEYKYKTEKIKQKIDTLFNDEEYDIIETMYRLIVERKKPIVSELNEELI